ncbi:unnamed protein product [Caenorhabditis angaria]|uniref:SXP/RAL-2 family protein Ani s 5-like cation-binding domain-containing protein n=1 Tax=Caenorhabditis angaria TaxID=860376 RepID=A0A9P1IEE1_9PELO|nr:unnamed protein product [Caenorhabditis angaria]
MSRCIFLVSAIFVAVALCQNDNLPPFLHHASAEQVKAFEALINDHGHLNEVQLDAEVQAWVAKQGGEVAADFAKFQEFIKTSHDQAEAAHQSAIASWSPAAKKADADLTALSRDLELPVKVKAEKIQAYLAGLPADIRKEIEGNQQ